MKLGVLFSGGKDSCYAAYRAKQKGHQLACLISIISKNPDSYMFHTLNIKLVKAQAKLMNLPLITQNTKGEKEKELADLEKATKLAIKKYRIQGIVTGAIASNYQKSRIEAICKKLKISCVNPLWNKDELTYLNELIENNFKVIIAGVFAYPLDKTWLGREINREFVQAAIDLNNKHKIHIAGEGGEFETLVVDCPLFKSELEIKNQKISGKGNAWRMEVE
jgi:asparagine synthase (glutamine-hydrolysing)